MGEYEAALEVNTNNHINEYSCSFRLELSCDLLTVDKSDSTH
jgi:hypothetical protein